MTRRLVIAMTLLVAVVAIALAVPLTLVVATDQRASFVSNLEVDTLSAASLLSSEPSESWGDTVAALAQQTGARVVIVDSDRNLLADSDDSALDRSFDRPEITRALTGELASDVRSSATLGEDLRYVAAPVVQDYATVAAVRLTLAESIVDSQVRRTALWLVIFVLAVIAAAALVAWLLARSIASPLRHLGGVAQDLPLDLSRRADDNEGPAEVRAVARALNSTARRLSGILQRTQRVAADASHHLRTPLTGVRLRLEAIEDISTEPPVQFEARAAIEEVDRLNRRIDQVLALARTDAGQQAMELQDASAVVAARADAAEAMFQDRGVEMEVSTEPGLLVRAPSGVIARIVDELLGNAATYARARVDVSLIADEDLLRLAVADDGDGVAEAEREVIFDRFARGSTAAPGGSGLGLALVSESVAGLGGRTRAAQSELGGLAIVVEIPLAPGRVDLPN